MIELDWHKCIGDIWCNLYRIDANHKNLSGFSGIYIIWSGKFEGERNVLLTGYGDIKKIILQYKEDIAVKAFEHLGVFISWADVPYSNRKQVVNFLINTLNPKMTTKIEKGGEREVNLPKW
jgi:hypothetical protein